MGRWLARVVILAIVLATVPGCSPLRLVEAVHVLADIGAGTGPSTFKEETPRPTRASVRYAVDGRERHGDLYLPGARALAGMVLVPGVTRLGKDDPRLVALAMTLARARFEVLVPDLPNLRDLMVSSADTRALADASVFLDNRGGRSRPTGLTAVSYAVGPAVAALFEPDMAGRIDFVVAIGGYRDLEATVAFFTTGYYRTDPGAPWRYRRPNAYGKWVFVRSNAGRLKDPRDRSLLTAMAQRKLDNLEADISDLTATLGPEGRSVYALLANKDPERVPDLIAGLPKGIATDMAALDLKRRDLGALKIHFVLIHGRDDSIIPETQSESLAAALKDADLFVLDSLSHVDLKPGGIFDTLKFLRAIYIVLELRDAEPKTRATVKGNRQSVGGLVHAQG